ncbi:MAG: DUF6057 family protein [Dysgonamonadaceae bacterium]|nr:DUF6057 family protein [Dysgonamonadaceae bacterium]
MERFIQTITARRIISGFIFLFAWYWFACMNRYNTLYYQEQTQLFLFNPLYFHTYWTQVGGIILYAGSFFTQFSYFPALGACIYGGAVWLTAVLYNCIRKYYRLNGWYVLSFFPAVCMIFANVDLNFRLSYTLSLPLVLVFFRIYLSLPLRYRSVCAALMIFLVYLIAGGNVFLLLLLLLCDVFFGQKSSIVQKTGKALICTVLSLIIPWCAWRFGYVVPLKDAFLEASPWNLFYPNYFYAMAWLAFPVLLLAGLAAERRKQTGNASGKWLNPVNTLLTIGLLAGGIGWSYNKQANLTVQMSYLLEKGEWKKVTELSSLTLPSELTSCFNNIALSKTGELSGQMFHYNQVGAGGLLLGKKNGYFNRYAMGVLFYHLGIVAEAKHCAFEALVGNSIFKEPGAQALRYLVNTSILQRNQADFDKYIRFFDQSLFYRRWAKLQKERMNQAVLHPDAPVEGLSKPEVCKDFFINYKYIHSSLLYLLESNPHNQTAFEYLMAYYMLQKDFGSARNCLDKYYARFNYREMPAHWEELLALYYQINRHIVPTLPVSRETAERYEQFRILIMAPSSGEISRLLKSRYGNTYWYYTTFTPVSLFSEATEHESKTIY